MTIRRTVYSGVLVAFYAFAFLALPTAAHATVVAQHTGAADPTTEGWFASGPFVNVATGAVFNDNGSGFDAWMVDDNSTSSLGVYSRNVSAGEVATGTSSGWTMSSNLRVIDTPGGSIVNDGSPSISYRDGSKSWQMHFETTVGGLNVFLLTNVGVAGHTISVSGSADDYHLYELIFDSADGKADLFIDGALAFSDYEGANLVSAANISFGTGSTATLGQGNYNTVSLEVDTAVVPEISSWLIFAAGLVGLGAVRRRLSA
ncbi:MAG: hypothetical protein GKS01_10495 [Alphaproteobacteria bacterium]|nr:hypothetical protein [Alphaproteobacteria bacterium]